jgi:hypothetical protein
LHLTTGERANDRSRFGRLLSCIRLIGQPSTLRSALLVRTTPFAPARRVLIFACLAFFASAHRLIRLITAIAAL